MEYTVLGKSGLRVSRVGFGGIPIQRVSESAAVEALHAATDEGVNFIDTAAGYGDSQRKIGAAIRDMKRSDLVIASKSPKAGAVEILDDIQKALNELGTDYIDLYQLHGVGSREKWDRVRAVGGALEGLRRARADGLIHHIGFSSHSLDIALELIEIEEFETIQFPFNLVTREPAEKLIPRSREREVGFIVMKPLCGGQYDDAGLAFRFLNEYPDIVPIPGIETPDQIREIAEVVGSGETLQGDQLTAALDISERLGKRFCRRCGYCEPCPQGVPIQECMIFSTFIKRLPEEKVKAGPAAKVVEKAVGCTRCGACEAQCPYDLPIMDSVRMSLEEARDILFG